MLWLIYAQSATYASYGQYFVVEAEDSYQAEGLVLPYVEEYFIEQDLDDLVSDGLESEGPYGAVISITEFDESHEDWKFFKDPKQSSHYIQIKA